MQRSRQNVARGVGLITFFAGAVAVQIRIFPHPDKYGFEDEGTFVLRLAAVSAVVLAVNLAVWNRALLTRRAARIGAVVLGGIALLLLPIYIFWDLLWAHDFSKFVLETSVTIALAVAANVAAWRTPGPEATSVGNSRVG